MQTTLVCDAAAAPLTLVPMVDAVTKIVTGRASVLMEDEHRPFRAASLEVPAPIIIMVPRIIKLTHRERARPSRRIVFARDGYRCQYCGGDVSRRGAATIDHVKPRSRFADVREAETWDNLVTACRVCNERKGNRLPFECGMYPRTTPKAPNYIAARFVGRLREPAHLEYVATYYRLDPDILRAR